MDISVVIPVYNVGKYISKTIESLKNQNTECNYEVIIIDDGSTDESADIVDKYKTDNIHVVHTSNRGVSAARNTGIDMAKGEFITFVDGDDYVKPRFLNELYWQIKNSNADVSIQTYTTIFPDNHLQQHMTCNIERDINGIDYIDCHILSGGDTSSVAKIYKTSLLKKHDIKFPTDIFNLEDMYFLFKLSLYAKKITYNNISNYIRVARNDGVVFSKFNKKKLSAIKALKKVEHILIQRCMDYKLIKKNRARIFQNAIFFMIELDRTSKEYLSLKKIISNKIYWCNRYVNFKDIIKFILLKISPSFTQYVFRKHIKSWRESHF